MLQSIGHILVVVAALGLAAGEFLAMGVGLGRRATGDRRLQLTVLDVAARPSPAPLRCRALLRDARTGRPIGPARLVLRFEDGWTQPGWANARGRARFVRPGGLSAGCFWYEVHWPEQAPFLDVRARGTVWVLPAEAPILWVDAGAVLPKDPGEAPPAAALSVLNVLARRYALVYLVVGDADQYVRARRRLAAPDVAGRAPGMPFWVDAAARDLRRLRGVWPKVAAALLAAPRLRPQVAAADVAVLAVPPAGGPPQATEGGGEGGPEGADEAEAAQRWRRVGAELGTPAGPVPNEEE